MNNIKDAMQLVMDYKDKGKVVAQGTFDVNPKDILEGVEQDAKDRGPKKVKRGRNWDKEKRPDVKYTIISLITTDLTEEFVCVFEGAGISVAENVEVGDSVQLNITSNMTAVWEKS